MNDHKPYRFWTYVFQNAELALTLGKNHAPVRVEVTPHLLPDGFSICRMVQEEDLAVVEEMRPCNTPPQNDFAKRLETHWQAEYPSFQIKQKTHRLRQESLSQPFLGLDIESDGAKIWESALIPSDGTQEYVQEKNAPFSKETFQEQLKRLSLRRTIVGHNIRKWDLMVLGRDGVLMDTLSVWDTLAKEEEICRKAEKKRYSYALQTAHHADADARKTIELAQNQWLRQEVPEVCSELKQQAWEASDEFFIKPSPTWGQLVPRFNAAWLDLPKIKAQYEVLELAKVWNAIRIRDLQWFVVEPPRNEKEEGPFNPASPKRIDYWHRLLPAIIAARQGCRCTLFFITRQTELERLSVLLTGARAAKDLSEARSEIRALFKRGGLLILHDSLWAEVLMEELPQNTAVILEKMPEKTVGSNSASAEVVINQVHDEEDKLSIENTDDAEGAEVDQDEPNKEIQLPQGQKALPMPDNEAFGKMLLWRHTAAKDLRFVCLDARLWNARTEALTKITPLKCNWKQIISREKVEKADFHQSTGEYQHKPDWKQDIIEQHNQGRELHDFQCESLERILEQRDNLPFEYIIRATGGGKSLVFQAAALYRGGNTKRLTVVISPLRALIHDQVEALHNKGFALEVEALCGDMPRSDIEEAYRRIEGGETLLVYTAPERFRSKAFQRILENRINGDAGGQPEYWVFDEAHCVSLWGLDFRPDYRKAADYIRESRKEAAKTAAPVLLVSATLTQIAKNDIETVLGFRS